MARREPVRLLHLRNVCFWHKADITIAWNHVRFRGVKQTSARRV